MLRKVKQLLSNFEAERWENLSNLRLAKKSVAYKKTLVYESYVTASCWNLEVRLGKLSLINAKSEINDLMPTPNSIMAIT